MNYGDAEKEISQRLNLKFSERMLSDHYEAAPVPETENEAKLWYGKINKARVSVEYIDSSYDPDNGLDTAQVVERVRFKATFEARKRRGVGGIYTLIELTKLFLNGFCPQNADRLTPVKFERYLTEENCIQFSIDFECKTINVEVDPNNPAPPLEENAVFKEISFEEQFNS